MLAETKVRETKEKNENYTHNNPKNKTLSWELKVCRITELFLRLVVI
jgi:hypothetical protein